MARDPKGAAAPAEPQDGREWHDVATGLGEEWQFESEGPLVGHFLGSVSKPVKGDDGKTREQSVYQFAPEVQPDAIAFVWGSYTLDQAFTGDGAIEVGQLCRIQFLGYGQFKNESGPRQIKRYRVQVA